MRRRQMHRPRLILLVLGTAAVALVFLFRAPLRYWLLTRATLASEAPAVAVLQQIIRKAADPRAAILAEWNTKKIVQREVAIEMLSRVVPTRQPLSKDLHVMLLSAALDPDSNVRENALSYLERRQDPALPALAAAQFDDPDPQLRLLGLQYLKHAPASVGVPTVVRLLDDPDPRVVATAIRLLENWSGEHFGVKLADSVEVADEKTGLEEFRLAGVDRIRAGAGRAKAWWNSHRSDYDAVHLQVPQAALAARQRIPAADFSLPTLNDGRVRFSEFRGRVVLINFWTTWCTACLSEMPELIALHNRDGDNVPILGISLDFVPAGNGDRESSPEAIRRKIERVVRAHGVNYRVLLDEKDTVGGRFNGGELPTTVIVDARGYVRRRFIGARSLRVFEAMIASASRPANSPEQER